MRREAWPGGRRYDGGRGRGVGPRRRDGGA